MSATQASYHHVLKLGIGDDVTQMADRNINPDLTWIRKQYRMYTKAMYGDGKNDVDKLKKYAMDHSSQVDMKFEFSPDNSKYTIALVTPLIKRVHELMPESKEVVFLDSTANVDTLNSVLTILVCASPAGALPLGIFIADSNAKESYIRG